MRKKTENNYRFWAGLIKTVVQTGEKRQVIQKSGYSFVKQW